MTHPTITKELALQLAREAGAHDAGHNYFGMSETKIHTLAKAIYKLGRNAGLDEAKQVCLKGDGAHDHLYAQAIESLKDNTP